MSGQDNIFVVVDPNDDKQVALERAIITAGLRTPKAKLFVFIGVDNETVDMRSNNDNLFRGQEWFDEEVHQPIKAAGLDYDLEVSWSIEWRKSIIQSAKRFGANYICLPMHPRTNTRRFTFSEPKWELLEGAESPIILVRPGAKSQRSVVLAAVNFQASRDGQQELNTKILEHGKYTAEKYGAEFHIVNAYLDSMHYPDRGKLANEAGIPAEQIHVKPGYTDEVVAQVAKEIGADIVVMGTLGQTGKTKTRRGNTAARVIGGLDVDVLVFNELCQ